MPRIGGVSRRRLELSRWLKIETCDYPCGYQWNDCKGTHRCMHPGAPRNNKVNGTVIPTWCPLPPNKATVLERLQVEADNAEDRLARVRAVLKEWKEIHLAFPTCPMKIESFFEELEAALVDTEPEKEEGNG